MPSSISSCTPAREFGFEPIPGYKLVEILGGGSFGEVWKCTAPGGLAKAIKFIDLQDHGLSTDDQAVAQELDALERVKALRHPFILSLDRVERSEHGLMMVMELADATMLDRFREAVDAGQQGIPAEELIPLIMEAAEALDVLSRNRLQHLDVKPANLFLIHGHLKLGDFSLVCSLDTPRNEGSWIGLTPKYASPEVLQGVVSPAADQYSLALVTYELMTGRSPYRAASAQQALMMHIAGTPDLSLVSEMEAAIFERALAKQPEERFKSCLDFAHQLALAYPIEGPASQSLSRTPLPSRPVAQRTLPCLASVNRYESVFGAGRPSDPDLDILRANTTKPAWGAKADRERPRSGALPPTRMVDEDGLLGFGTGSGDGRSPAEIVHEMIRLSLIEALGAQRVSGAKFTDLFCRFPVRAERAHLIERIRAFTGSRNAEVVTEAGNEVILAFPVNVGWVRRLFFQPPLPIHLLVSLSAAGEGSGSRGEAMAMARGCGGDDTRHASVRQGLAAEVLHGLRAALTEGAENRRGMRHPVRTPVILYPIDETGGEPGFEVGGWSVDLSAGGARVVSKADLRIDHFYLRFPEHPTAPRMAILCSIVRRALRDTKQIEYGCRFADDLVPRTEEAPAERGLLVGAV